MVQQLNALPEVKGDRLPTMYDLPSESEEDGLPDEYHDYQPELLRVTFCPPDYPQDQVFSGSDLYLYYDLNHTGWYKRPDWFGVVGVSRLYEGDDLRYSYVMWQEKVSPVVAVELLSTVTKKEDLGKTISENPPTKWKVYEQILKIPYYLLFDRRTNKLQVFKLESDRYQELKLATPKIWLPEIQLGVGVWYGSYQGATRTWLRWYDAQGDWIPTDADRAEKAQKRAETAERRAEDLAQRLRDLGIEP
jgi:Uma2 family endonuclease